MKRFSCKNFFENVEKERIFRKYYVARGKEPCPCSPDFEQKDDEVHYAPEEHLMKVHGFLEKAPKKKRRTLEIELCKTIEATLTDLN